MSVVYVGPAYDIVERPDHGDFAFFCAAHATLISSGKQENKKTEPRKYVADKMLRHYQRYHHSSERIPAVTRDARKSYHQLSRFTVPERTELKPVFALMEGKVKAFNSECWDRWGLTMKKPNSETQRQHFLSLLGKAEALCAALRTYMDSNGGGERHQDAVRHVVVSYDSSAACLNTWSKRELDVACANMEGLQELLSRLKGAENCLRSVRPARATMPPKSTLLERHNAELKADFHPNEQVAIVVQNDGTSVVVLMSSVKDTPNAVLVNMRRTVSRFENNFKQGSISFAPQYWDRVWGLSLHPFKFGMTRHYTQLQPKLARLIQSLSLFAAAQPSTREEALRAVYMSACLVSMNSKFVKVYDGRAGDDAIQEEEEEEAEEEEKHNPFVGSNALIVEEVPPSGVSSATLTSSSYAAREVPSGMNLFSTLAASNEEGGDTQSVRPMKRRAFPGRNEAISAPVTQTNQTKRRKKREETSSSSVPDVAVNATSSSSSSLSSSSALALATEAVQLLDELKECEAVLRKVRNLARSALHV